MTDRNRQKFNRELAVALRALSDVDLERVWKSAEARLREMQSQRAVVWREYNRRKRAAKSIPPAEPALRGEL